MCIFSAVIFVTRNETGWRWARWEMCALLARWFIFSSFVEHNIFAKKHKKRGETIEIRIETYTKIQRTVKLLVQLSVSKLIAAAVAAARTSLNIYSILCMDDTMCRTSDATTSDSRRCCRWSCLHRLVDDVLAATDTLRAQMSILNAGWEQLGVNRKRRHEEIK